MNLKIPSSLVLQEGLRGGVRRDRDRPPLWSASRREEERAQAPHQDQGSGGPLSSD